MLTPPVTAPDETRLLSRARAGDASAVAELYELHHAPALRLAQALSGPDGAEDLLADAITRVVARIGAGAGPSSNFHGYLFAAIRNRHRDLQQTAGREEPASDQPWLLDTGAEPAVELPEELDDARVAAALATLPEAWQRVLWLLEVRELPVPDVAERLGLTLAAVSSLAYRAREGLRTAYLDQTLGPAPCVTSECVWVRGRLSRFVRAALGATGASRVESHLHGCRPCTALLGDLQRINRRFRFYRLPTPPAATYPSPVRATGTAP